MDRKAKAAATFVSLMLILISGVPIGFGAQGNVPGGAASLFLSVAPPTLPADGSQYLALVVSLVDSSDLPSIALANTTVFLTSSQQNIATVPSQVVIDAGSTYTVVTVSTTTTPGVTTLTASSLGLVSVSTQLNTATPSGLPSTLEVFASPGRFISSQLGQGELMVELVDAAGLPSKAIAPVTVQLSSSNASIAGLGQSSVTIAQGSLLGTGVLRTSTSLGTAVITASSTGFVSGEAVVTVATSSCSRACAPSGLSIRPLLHGSMLPADGNSYSVLEVGLIDTSGNPTPSPSDTVVQLFSSQSGIISMSSLVTIPAGTISTLAELTTSALAGTVTITASSSGLLPGTTQVQSIIPPPSKLQAFLSPPSVSVTSSGNWPILTVQLQDSGGYPARARQDVNVTVTSSNSSMVTRPLFLKISAGTDFVSSDVNATGSGKSVLTVASQGLSPSQVSLELQPSPLNVQLATPNSVILFNQTAVFTFSVTFLGGPLKGVNVTWTASGGVVSPGSGHTASGGTAVTTFTPTRLGLGNVTVSAYSAPTGPIERTYPILIAAVPPRPTLTFVQFLEDFWYLWVAVVVVVILISVFFFRRRRARTKEELEAAFESLT